MSESEYYLRFSYAPGIGPKRFLLLLSYFKTAEKAWKGTATEYKSIGITGKTYEAFDIFRQHFDYSKIQSALKVKGIKYISQHDEIYPKSLLKLSNPPIGLFAKGEITLLKEELIVAVVGSRKMTSYGNQVSQLFVEELVRAGAVIISGLAMGIDAAAHSAALESNGKTIAVLGNGVNVPYPQENFSLYEKILSSNNLIISEYPPDISPTKGSFPARNRIIAALSRAVLIPEAVKDSGSLITATNAIELGIPIFAVPGQITSQQSQGTSYLIQNGAKLVIEPEDILKSFDLSGKSTSRRKLLLEKLSISQDAKKVLELLLQEPMSVDTLSKKNMMEVTEVSRIITLLELQGYVKDSGNGKFVADI